MSAETTSSKYDFDDLIGDVRQFGPFQWRMFAIAGIFEAPAAMGLLFFVFGGANPGWHCEGLTNTTLSLPTSSTPLSVPTSPGKTLSDSNNTQEDQCLQECPVRVYNDDFTSVVTEVRTIAVLCHPLTNTVTLQRRHGVSVSNHQQLNSFFFPTCC